jgi:hypothetical protein
VPLPVPDAVPGGRLARILRAVPAELVIAGAFLCVTLVAALWTGMPLSLPNGERAAFVGIHYLYPLIGVALCGAVILLYRRDALALTFLVALPAYALILLCHFNLKLWIPHLNPLLWDEAYWHIDQALRPLVDACFAIRQAIAPVVPLDSNFYMTAFITLFYLSFCIHAVRDRHDFRTLFLAALLFQGLGAIAYLLMPALGPFIYEQGVEPLTTVAQHSMLNSYHENAAGGAAWIAANGGAQLTVGVAAMPSLHTGGAFLFLLFAWRGARVLLPIYVPLFAFIAIDAVANRWHYLVDLPAGMTLAALCAWMAIRLNPRRTAISAPAETSRDPLAALFARLKGTHA